MLIFITLTFFCSRFQQLIKLLMITFSLIYSKHLITPIKREEVDLLFNYCNISGITCSITVSCFLSFLYIKEMDSLQYLITVFMILECDDSSQFFLPNIFFFTQILYLTQISFVSKFFCPKMFLAP